jgi:hypothetical protein
MYLVLAGCSRLVDNAFLFIIIQEVILCHVHAAVV